MQLCNISCTFKRDILIFLVQFLVSYQMFRITFYPANIYILSNCSYINVVYLQSKYSRRSNLVFSIWHFCNNILHGYKYALLKTCPNFSVSILLRKKKLRIYLFMKGDKLKINIKRLERIKIIQKKTNYRKKC